MPEIPSPRGISALSLFHENTIFGSSRDPELVHNSRASIRVGMAKMVTSYEINGPVLALSVKFKES